MDNYIGIDEPAEVTYEKCMKIPDNLLGDYFRLTTDIPTDAYSPLLASDIRQAHFVYAREIVKMYHGDNATEHAEKRYISVASGKIPDNIKTISIASSEILIVKLLKQAGFATSNSDARRLIDGGGIKINGETVSDIGLSINQDAVVSRGKNKFVKVRFGVINPATYQE